MDALLYHPDTALQGWRAHCLKLWECCHRLSGPAPSGDSSAKQGPLARGHPSLGGGQPLLGWRSSQPRTTLKGHGCFWAPLMDISWACSSLSPLPLPSPVSFPSLPFSRCPSSDTPYKTSCTLIIISELEPNFRCCYCFTLLWRGIFQILTLTSNVS